MIRRYPKLLAAVLAATAAAAPFAQSVSPPSPENPYAGQKKLVDAQPGELRVFATAAFQGPLESVRKRAQQALGRPIRIEYGSARGNLKTQIAEGQAFDVAILLPDVIGDPVIKTKVRPQQFPLAQVPVGIGFRGDGPIPNVSTPAALEASLRNAGSVHYYPTGAARETVERIITKLKLAGRIRDNSSVRGTVALTPGDYEISLQPMSEILSSHTLRNLGLVPSSLQVPARIQAVISRKADIPASRAFIRFLEGPDIDPSLRAGGMAKGR